MVQFWDSITDELRDWVRRSLLFAFGFLRADCFLDCCFHVMSKKKEKRKKKR